MIVNKQIDIHTKCQCILEMISKVDYLIDCIKERLTLFNNTSDWTAPIRLMNTRESFDKSIAKMQGIKERLLSYYKNTVIKLL